MYLPRPCLASLHSSSPPEACNLHSLPLALGTRGDILAHIMGIAMHSAYSVLTLPSDNYSKTLLEIN